MSVYLYVKRCKHCGLKYFGKTINENVEQYLGSGTYWKRHIKSHGEEHIVTDNIWYFEIPSDATNFALNFSKENNIVDSGEWANLIPEDGLDGNSKHVITEELREKFRRANKGKNNPMYGTIWINNGSENRKIRSESDIPPGWIKGRYFDNEARKKFVSRPRSGKNNTNYDPTIRHWINIETGEEISLPKYDFCQLKMLNGKKIRAVVQGKIEHYRGWKLKSF